MRYYDSVVATISGLEQVQDFFKLYIVPGGGHMSPHSTSNEGANPPTFGPGQLYTMIVNWVEQRAEPTDVGITSPLPAPAPITQPIYPYPAKTVYVVGTPPVPSAYTSSLVKEQRVRHDRSECAEEVVDRARTAVARGRCVLGWTGRQNWNAAPCRSDDAPTLSGRSATVCCWLTCVASTARRRRGTATQVECRLPTPVGALVHEQHRGPAAGMRHIPCTPSSSHCW